MKSWYGFLPYRHNLIALLMTTLGFTVYKIGRPRQQFMYFFILNIIFFSHVCKYLLEKCLCICSCRYSVRTVQGGTTTYVCMFTNCIKHYIIESGDVFLSCCRWCFVIEKLIVGYLLFITFFSFSNFSFFRVENVHLKQKYL